MTLPLCEALPTTLRLLEVAHHKRRRAKNRRAGCLFCKPHKQNHAGKMGKTLQELKSDEAWKSDAS